jgi:hypothetical protein
MNMTQIDPWKDLRKPEDQEGLSLLLIDPEVHYLWSWAKDAKGNIGIAIEFNNNNFDISKIIQTKSLNIKFKEYGSKFILSILTSDKSLIEPLRVFCMDLVDQTSTQKDESYFFYLLTERINSWCNLFKRGIKKLSSGEILGLAAELSFLKIWLTNKNENIIDWVGPEQKPQDFISEDSLKAYEIKITSWDREAIHISSLQQLDFDGILKLVIYPGKIVDEIQPKATNLKLLIEDLKKICSQDDYFILLNKLLLIGYKEIDCIDTFFEIQEPIAFSVNDDFPKLTARTVDSSITKCNYKISLLSLDKFKTDL